MINIFTNFKNHKNFDNFPGFIISFLDDISKNICKSKDKKEKREIIHKLDDQNYFNYELSKEILLLVEIFLGIDDDSDKSE